MRNADSIEQSKEIKDYETVVKKPHRSRKISEKSLANLKPFKSGAEWTGNAGGRPKNDIAAEIARAIFENNREALYEAYGRAALKGNAYTFKELADRGFGKIADNVKITGVENLAEDIQQARLRAQEEE